MCFFSGASVVLPLLLPALSSSGGLLWEKGCMLPGDLSAAQCPDEGAARGSAAPILLRPPPWNTPHPLPAGVSSHSGPPSRVGSGWQFKPCYLPQVHLNFGKLPDACAVRWGAYRQPHFPRHSAHHLFLIFFPPCSEVQKTEQRVPCRHSHLMGE